MFRPLIWAQAADRHDVSTLASAFHGGDTGDDTGPGEEEVQKCDDLEWKYRLDIALKIVHA